MEKTILNGHMTRDGAGVKLFRVFAHDHTELTDPFLLLDHFGSDDPDDYILGFPWHPHRGIETVTYMLEGEVEHGDTLGNKGVIGPGDIQWMTAGSGVFHQEMPKPLHGRMYGMQLWVNLPAKSKMMPPRYRGITADEVPVVKKKGIEVRIVAGTYDSKSGPVKDLVVGTDYFDVTLDQGATFSYPVKKGYMAFCYIFEGEADFQGTLANEKKLVLFRDTPKITVQAIQRSRFILVSGKPLKEPIAWGGPIVMNTEQELETAYRELERGNFVKAKV